MSDIYSEQFGLKKKYRQRFRKFIKRLTHPTRALGKKKEITENRL